jgi:hypothetical protein
LLLFTGVVMMVLLCAACTQWRSALDLRAVTRRSDVSSVPVALLTTTTTTTTTTVSADDDEDGTSAGGRESVVERVTVTTTEAAIDDARVADVSLSVPQALLVCAVFVVAYAAALALCAAGCVWARAAARDRTYSRSHVSFADMCAAAACSRLSGSRVLYAAGAVAALSALTARTLISAHARRALAQSVLACVPHTSALTRAGMLVLLVMHFSSLAGEMIVMS